MSIESTGMSTQPDGASLPTVLLWGAGSQARIVQEMLRESGMGTVGAIFDATMAQPDFSTPARFTQDPGVLRCWLPGLTHYVVCIGNEYGYARVRTAACLGRLGLKPMTLVHHRSFIEPSAAIGVGCQVMPCAVVHKFASIGEQTILNTNASIDHECVIGSGVHIMGAAAVAGRVRIGDFATIGTNATVLPNLVIGEGAFVGAGAVVTEDVAPYTLVMGVPARPVRAIQPRFMEDALLALADPAA